METQRRRFWAKVYFIVKCDLFPGLWRLYSLTFTSSQAIDAFLITEKASLTAISWLCAFPSNTSSENTCKSSIVYGNMDAEKWCKPNWTKGFDTVCTLYT